MRAQLEEIERGFFDRVETRSEGDVPRSPGQRGEGQRMNLLGTYFSRLQQRSPIRWQGRVVEAAGQTIESEGPPCSVGECCEIRDSDARFHAAEVIGFRGNRVLSMTLARPTAFATGIR